MTSYQKFGLVAGQILIGLGSGLVGAIVSLVLVEQGQLDLYGGIMSILTGSYIGMQVGIGIDGFNFLKRQKRQAEFLRFFLQSFLGLVAGLTLLFAITSLLNNNIPHWLINFLTIGLPLTGVIVGFNFRLAST